ncbi:hypothetical protein [Pseudoalteromonas piscicida]|uniref:hypothetical protein n=1 Tax=Pseudoalteromonas piscicida TaxID=43662 RepID=UPI003C7DEF4A
MKRRTFMFAGAALTVASVLPPVSFARQSFTASGVSKDTTERLPENLLNELGIQVPIRDALSPSGERVSFQKRANIIRRYGDSLYVYFEHERVIRVFDTQGNPDSNELPLPKYISDLKDFAVDPTLQQLYLLQPGKHHIVLADFGGEIVSTFGEFGIEQDYQLNGPKSITIGKSNQLFVLNSGSSSIKVFDSNGVFLKNYTLSQKQKRTVTSIDGANQIIINGGKFSDRQWKLDQNIRNFIEVD